MVILFLTPTNIRKSILDLDKPPLGIIHAGTSVEVEDKLFEGAEIDGINTYFKDAHGWYYWSGRAVIKYKALPPPADTSAPSDSTPKSEAIGGSWVFTAQQPEPQVQPPATSASTIVDESESLIVIPSADESIPHATDQSASQPRSIFTPHTSSAPQNESRSAARFPAPATWHYTEGMQAWGPDDDQVAEKLWDHFGLSGQRIKVGIIDTNPWHHSYQNAAIKQHKNWQKGNSQQANPIPLPLHTLLTGASTVNWQGLIPNAQVLLATISGDDHPQSGEQLHKSLEWLLAQQVEILLVNGTWPEHQQSLGLVERLEAVYSKFAAANVLAFAPVGEGKGLRPVRNWPAASEFCFSVGAYIQNRLPSPSNQKSNQLDFLAPGEHSSSDFVGLSKTSLAAAYAAGTVGLLLELTKTSNLHWSYEDWRELLHKAGMRNATPQGTPLFHVPSILRGITRTVQNM